MLRPDLGLLAHWLDPDLVSVLEIGDVGKRSGIVVANWQRWKHSG